MRFSRTPISGDVLKWLVELEMSVDDKKKHMVVSDHCFCRGCFEAPSGSPSGAPSEAVRIRRRFGVIMCIRTFTGGLRRQVGGCCGPVVTAAVRRPLGVWIG